MHQNNINAESWLSRPPQVNIAQNKKEYNDIYFNKNNLLQEFELSEYGFLPHECCNILPENFQCYQTLLDNLPENKSTGEQFRKFVMKLPKYDAYMHSIDKLDIKQRRFLFSILTMIVNRYIWCTGVQDAKNHAIIPAIIAVPLFLVAEKLGIVIALTHASVDLWNWHLIDSTKPFSLENIEVNHTMTGNKSEAWFYMIMIAIEGISGDSLHIMSHMHKYFDNKELIEQWLIILQDNITKITRIIKKMYDHCDPEFFFNNLRIYLSGSGNNNLPNGVILNLESLDRHDLVIRYDGGSAAQSSLIQSFDEFFSVKHEDHGGKFLQKMRNYMPNKHRKFLEKISELPTIKDHIEMTKDVILIEHYDKCLKNLVKFRKVHLDIIHAYIVKFIPKPNISEENNNTSIFDNDKNAHGEKGSGGMSPVEFCEQIISDTKNTKAQIGDMQNVQDVQIEEISKVSEMIEIVELEEKQEITEIPMHKQTQTQMQTHAQTQTQVQNIQTFNETDNKKNNTLENKIYRLQDLPLVNLFGISILTTGAILGTILTVGLTAIVLTKHIKR